MRRLIRKHAFAFSFLKRRSKTADLEKREDSPRGSVSDSSNPATTAKNVVKTALKTLSAISNNIPICGIITSVIDPLLVIMTQADLTSANVEGLVELAARIERLTPLVADMAEVNSISERERRFIDDLTCELQSIRTDVSDAQAQGMLTRFFNSHDDAAGIAKHNATLAQLIADATLVNVQEVRRTLRNMERSVSMPPLQGQIEIGYIAGGTGGTGASGGRLGGEGGDGEGPEFDIPIGQNVKFGGIAGGTGGEGGEGLEEGGKGGFGMAPKIRFAPWMERADTS